MRFHVTQAPWSTQNPFSHSSSMLLDFWPSLLSPLFSSLFSVLYSLISDSLFLHPCFLRSSGHEMVSVYGVCKIPLAFYFEFQLLRNIRVFDRPCVDRCAVTGFEAADGFSECLTQSTGIRSKRHMKIILKWMRGQNHIKLVCNHIGDRRSPTEKEFLYTYVVPRSERLAAAEGAAAVSAEDDPNPSSATWRVDEQTPRQIWTEMQRRWTRPELQSFVDIVKVWIRSLGELWEGIGIEKMWSLVELYWDRRFAATHWSTGQKYVWRRGGLQIPSLVWPPRKASEMECSREGQMLHLECRDRECLNCGNTEKCLPPLLWALLGRTMIEAGHIFDRMTCCSYLNIGLETRILSSLQFSINFFWVRVSQQLSVSLWVCVICLAPNGTPNTGDMIAFHCDNWRGISSALRNGMDQLYSPMGLVFVLIVWTVC